MKRIACIAAVLGLGLMPAVAQKAPPETSDDVPRNGPLGIAFVQAPEMASGMALALTPEEGFAAATAQCVAGGAMAGDCLHTNWCLPAGWSVDLFVMHQEGVHWHEVHCGLPSREVAEQVAEALCNPASRDWLSECLPVQFYDPEGTALLPEG
ncbi:hypothetical protein [Pararhodobacter sp.]|uniref:hypothetical protein n=1 Tax=Pararhodobacter sp. TaxID=2127056 RepID=UPI002FDD4D38